MVRGSCGAPRFPSRRTWERRLKVLPSAPDIKAQLVNYNYDWWIANRENSLGEFGVTRFNFVDVHL